MALEVKDPAALDTHMRHADEARALRALAGEQDERATEALARAYGVTLGSTVTTETVDGRSMLIDDIERVGAGVLLRGRMVPKRGGVPLRPCRMWAHNVISVREG